ncbi:PLP-dependent aminotransferase family protein [Siccirubricoccus sp. KC 17139]|uniref:PLP-dependent aminotransferase family protein n=1 Tax=Siccirubricoccus soli TaxID=2899147 RepID=A0ABT1DAX1_9PROT|nr:PLP-dependent aminotransferase family protein [Siccirubricoccus soli]MCO6419090.1 PLP-dependent aminotransferase family protein [Siccirubricoccus soli]MCP2685225.1 PLP-dependent aminotransferase family protein [Siccirubricoccus soli]
MAPRPDLSESLLIALDRGSGVPALRQVYLGIRQAVLEGRLPPGARLPASRALAAQLGLARNTVVAAYDQLLAEGIIEGKVGAGSFVSRDLPKEPEPAPAPGPASPAAPAALPDTLPPAARRFAAALAAPLAATGSTGAAACNTGRTSWDPRTAQLWRSLTLRHLQAPSLAMLGYADPRGSAPLREAIAAYLRAARAVRCTPEQIVVTAGAQQAIDLVLKVLVEPGEQAWVEDPCYPAVRAALTAAQAALVPVPVDAQGLVVAEGVAAAPGARLAYVTPSSQYPLGVVLSMARRLELLAWARQAGAYVLEDDYDSEFRYAGRPLAALQGIDDAGRVIYIGTFSKVLFPGLRLGYAVLPPALVEPVLGARLLSDWHPPALVEEVVTDFIAEGHFAQHLRRMRQHYRAARDVLVAALQGIPGLVAEAPEQGMKLLARLGPGLRDTEVAAAAARRGVIARPVSPMVLAAPPLQGLMLGFTGHEPAALRRAAREIAACLAPAGEARHRRAG